ncbi:MAG: helix-turn-helix transcriptional regulator [Gammaproteobacteria bacterium]|nr:helix-turn-helix transcriptional regulator [Gammaproteobacteria bacterium]
MRKTAGILDGKWTTLIVRDLLPGKQRYSELLKSLQGISPKMLAARLSFLEARGIISKKMYPVVPPKTEYQLTPLGRGLSEVIAAMAAFGEKIK